MRYRIFLLAVCFCAASVQSGWLASFSSSVSWGGEPLVSKKPTAKPVAFQVRHSHRDPIPVAEAINREWRRALELSGVKSTESADDSEFLRRVCLDVTGRIPNYQRAIGFLNESTLEKPEKRRQLIDDLLASRDFGVHFAQRWRTLIWPRDTSSSKQAADRFTPWLADQFQSNRAWSEIVTDLITSEMIMGRDPQATFILANSDSQNPKPNLLSAATGRLFLGVQIGCAECHNHPFAPWTQNDFWGLAAFFSRVHKQSKSDASLTEQSDKPSMATIVIPDGSGKAAGSTVAARFLDGSSSSIDQDKALRPQLAAWMTARDNPYFARAMVNRLWAYFFGRGIVDPIDDIRFDSHSESQASQSQLLTLLAEEFVESDFDIQHLIRCVCLSEPYQCSSSAAGGSAMNNSFYRRISTKVMTPEVLYDSLVDAINADPLDRAVKATKLRQRPRIELGPREEWVRFFGRSSDAHAGDHYVYGIPELLRLMNSEPLNAVAPMIKELMDRGDEPKQIVETLYVVALSRKPTESELRRMLPLAQQNESREQGFADVFWVLLQSSEFVVIR